MTIDISNNNPRISYSVAAGVTQTSFAVPFEFFADTDLNVYVDEVLQTITTNYTVSGGDGSTGTITMTVTGAKTVLISRDTTIERTTDFTAGVDINRAALNTQLDTLTAIGADVKDLAERAIRIKDFDPSTASLELPAASVRADKLLSFDTEGNVQTQAASDLLTGSVLGANYTKASYTGNGTKTAYSTTSAAGSKNNIQVYIDGVYQNKDTFSISGTTLTFSEAPPLNSAIEFIVGNAVTSISGDATGINYTHPVGGTSRTVTAKLQDTINILEFGAVGDGTTDNASVFQALETYLLTNKRGGTVIVPEGDYLTTYPLKIQGHGIHVIGQGKAIIRAPDGATNVVFQAGVWGGAQYLTADLNENSSQVEVADATGYEVNDVVMVASGTSVNSTLPSNYIPLYKQVFTIREVDTVNNIIKFTAQAEHTFTVADDAQILGRSSSGTAPAVNCSVEGLTFTNTSGFSGPYLHAVNAGVNMTIRNCRFDGYSSCGYTTGSDHLTYDNCVFVGYNGMSCARYTKRVNYLNCSYRPRFSSPQDIGGFFEETPDTVYIDNCDIRSTVSFTSSSDAQPPKRFIMRNSRVEALSGGLSVNVSGYNSEGFAVIIDGCEIIGDGEAAGDGSGITCLLQIQYNNTCQITNTVFKTTNTSAYAIYGFSLGGGENSRMIYGNQYGTSLGVHSSVSASASFERCAIKGDLKVQEELTVEKTSGNNAHLVAFNDYNSSDAYGFFGSRATDANGMGAYFGVNAYTGSNYTSAIDREVSTFSGWAWTGYANNSANQSNDRFSVQYENTAGTQKEYLKINYLGDILPGATANNQDLGSGSKEWQDIYLVNSPTVSSDRNRKQQIAVLSDVEQTVAANVKGLVRKYKFNAAVNQKGDAARFHFGVIAQDVQQAFIDGGLDPNDYGIICTETWWEDANGVIYESNSEQGLTEQTRIAVRYEELLAFMIAAL